MVSLYSTWWIKPGQEKTILPALKKLADDVRNHEKGTLMYLVNYPKFDFPEVETGKNPIVSEPKVRPGTLVFFEIYRDWNAFKKHLYGDYFTKFVQDHGDQFVAGEDGGPFVQVVFLEEQAGFRRKFKKTLKKKKKSSARRATKKKKLPKSATK